MKLEVNLDWDEQSKKQVSLAAVIHAVCDVFKVSREQLLSPKRPAYLASARQAAYYLGWRDTRNSTPQIGRAMERDHTSVLAGRNVCIERMRHDEESSKNVEKAADLSQVYNKARREMLATSSERVRERVRKILEEESKRLEAKGAVCRKGAAESFFNPNG